MGQEIKEIYLKDLVLWTENPRDPVDVNSSDQDIADRSIHDGRSRWSIKKLFAKMGPRFDHSEIPTVAYVEEKPVVYDGNRRILIGKIINGFVTVDSDIDFSQFDFPTMIPCNVCDIRTALEHVDRKHGDSGSWKPLERDIFKHKHMKEKKSPFLVIEEQTGFISNNSELNQGFVKDEIFDSTNLHKMGFSTTDNKLKSRYDNDSDAKAVFDKIVHLVKEKEITTRKNRGKIIELLGNSILGKMGNDFRDFSLEIQPTRAGTRKTRITRGKEHALFGSKLSLESGSVNNIYSDLLRLYKQKGNGYSQDLHMIIRMGIRLLCELAFGDQWDRKVRDEFDSAKRELSEDEKTTLSSQGVEQSNIIQLLQSGAHAYTSSGNIEQTIAISLIIGKLLEIEHGRNQ